MYVCIYVCVCVCVCVCIHIYRIQKHEERRLQNGDLIKLVNPADATCPDNLFFTFYDTRPIPFIAYRIHLQVAEALNLLALLVQK